MGAAVSAGRVGDGLHRPVGLEPAADRRRHPGRRADRGRRRVVYDDRQQAGQKRPPDLSKSLLRGIISVVTGDGGWCPPGIPVSAGALIFDGAGRLLILKPTYKSGWTIPGGVMEADGETPWDACRREVGEECGLEVIHGRLTAMDFRRPKPGRAGGIRFLFDCGPVGDDLLAKIALQAEEISEYRLAAVPEALGLLRGPIR